MFQLIDGIHVSSLDDVDSIVAYKDEKDIFVMLWFYYKSTDGFGIFKDIIVYPKENTWESVYELCADLNKKLQLTKLDNGLYVKHPETITTVAAARYEGEEEQNEENPTYFVNVRWWRQDVENSKNDFSLEDARWGWWLSESSNAHSYKAACERANKIAEIITTTVQNKFEVAKDQTH